MSETNSELLLIMEISCLHCQFTGCLHDFYHNMYMKIVNSRTNIEIPQKYILTCPKCQKKMKLPYLPLEIYEKKSIGEQFKEEEEKINENIQLVMELFGKSPEKLAWKYAFFDHGKRIQEKEPKTDICGYIFSYTGRDWTEFKEVFQTMLQNLNQVYANYQYFRFGMNELQIDYKLLHFWKLVYDDFKQKFKAKYLQQQKKKQE